MMKESLKKNCKELQQQNQELQMQLIQLEESKRDELKEADLAKKRLIQGESLEKIF